VLGRTSRGRNSISDDVEDDDDDDAFEPMPKTRSRR
jgi:hypothetical protein